MPSYSQPDPFTQLRGQFNRSGAPFSMAIVAITLTLFLIDYFARGIVTFWLCCAFDYSPGTAGMTHFEHPWGILTYPLVNGNFIFALISAYTMWSLGGSLERSWGTQRFSQFAVASTLLTAFSVWLGCLLLHLSYPLAGLWLPLAPLAVAWAMINRGQSVNLMFALQVPAPIFAALIVGLVYFVAFGGQFVLGLFGLIPCLIAYLYAIGALQSTSRGYARRGPDLRMSGSAQGAKKSPSILDGSRPAGGPLGWLRAWQERRRLRKLWRDSGFGD